MNIGLQPVSHGQQNLKILARLKPTIIEDLHAHWNSHGHFQTRIEGKFVLRNVLTISCFINKTKTIIIVPWHDNKRRQTVNDCCYYKYLTVVVTVRLVSAPLNPDQLENTVTVQNIVSKGGSDPALKLLFTRIPQPKLLSLLSRISLSLPVPKPCPNFGESRSPVAVKPVSRWCFPNPALYFGSISDHRNTLQVPEDIFLTWFLQDSENLQVRTWFSF